MVVLNTSFLIKMEYFIKCRVGVIVHFHTGYPNGLCIRYCRFLNQGCVCFPCLKALIIHEFGQYIENQCRLKDFNLSSILICNTYTSRVLYTVPLNSWWNIAVHAASDCTIAQNTHRRAPACTSIHCSFDKIMHSL